MQGKSGSCRFLYRVPGIKAERVLLVGRGKGILRCSQKRGFLVQWDWNPGCMDIPRRIGGY